MPTPILKLPIDDAAFQRFLATFKKYQAALEAQPEMWKGMNKGISDTVAASAAMVTEIEQQTQATRKLAAEEAKRGDEAARASKRRRDDAKQQQVEEEEAQRRRRNAIDQVKEYSRSVASTALGIGKWALLGGVGGTAATIASAAFGMFGLDKLIGGVGDQRRTAQGLGVSMGQLTGMGVNMQRYFDVNSVLENVANMQGNPGDWGAFSVLGINPAGKTTAALTNDVTLAARRRFIADRGNLGLANAQGLTRFFSPDQLRVLAANPESAIRKSMADAEKLSKDAGLSDQVAKKWQDFMVAVDTAKVKITNTFVTDLSKFEPNLLKVTQEFGQLSRYIGPLLDKLAWFFGVGQTPHHADLGLGAPAASSASDNFLVRGEKWIDNWVSGLFGGAKSNGSLADRNNNPGNIMRGGHYMHFPSMEAGFNAMARQLKIDYDKHGQHTIRQLIDDPTHGWSNEWAPGNTHASTMNYIARVARELGISPDAQINLHDDRVLKKLMLAMNAVERGGHVQAPAPVRGGTVKVQIHNHTGNSVATTVNSAAGG